MLSAVEPDFDILEMGFDDYVVKPGDRERLLETIADVLARNAYDDAVYEYLTLSAKRALLEAGKPTESPRNAIVIASVLESELQTAERL
ncbi:HalX domain-containing protein [Halegenticoccus soli]|uniref:HalX domain-containing protein n=1 Tax=Halegenticoccus soli TaxID=1985678 RepID=UPI000C6D4AD3|nr:HalX domain-containing protein [Halegenticoccus soli]